MRRRRSPAQEPRPFGSEVAASGPPTHPAFLFFWGGWGDPNRIPLPGGRGTPAGLPPDCDGDPYSNAYTHCVPLVSVLPYPLSLSLFSPAAGSEEQLQRGSLPRAGYGGGTTRSSRRMVATTTGREDSIVEGRSSAMLSSLAEESTLAILPVGFLFVWLLSLSCLPHAG